MKRIVSVALLGWFAYPSNAPALDWTQLNAVKLLRTEKRYEEAIQKLEGMASSAPDVHENFHYLELAIQIASNSLKKPDLALALAAKVKDPALQDFANLRVLADFKRYDEALAQVRGKNIDAWPVRAQGSAHLILAEIYRLRGEDNSAQEHRLKAITNPGAEPVVRGNAALDAAQFYLKRGDPRKAEAMFRQALEISPAYYAWRNASLLALSGLLLQEKRPKEAVKLFEGMDFTKVENTHSRGQLLEAYARALLAAGKKIKAVETFDALLQSNIPDTWKDRINKELDQMAEDF